MLSEDLIKQIYFHSDRPRKDALVADEVDIVQFAKNIEAMVRLEAFYEEHQRCVKIVSDMNSEVGKALNNQRP